MKSILISIKPEWVVDILNGNKTVEIRKTMPKCELPCKVYIYCTKSNKYTCTINRSKSQLFRGYSENQIIFNGELCNGKVVAEFTLNKIDRLEFCHLGLSHTNAYVPTSENADYQWQKHSCVDYNKVVGYGKFAPLFVWHIDDLKIYDTPKELSDFETAIHCFQYKNIQITRNCFGDYVGDYYKNKFCHICKYYNHDFEDCDKSRHSLTRPPQSWCYVDVSPC